MLVTGQKLLASEQIKYSAFSRTFVGTWKQDKRFISSKKFNEITIKVRANIYLFIYLFIILLIYLFIILLGMACLFFYNSKLGPPFTSTQGASPPHSFLPFSRILKYGPRDPLSYQSSVSNPNQTPPEHANQILQDL